MRIKSFYIAFAASALLMLSSCIKEEWGVIPDNQNQTSNSTEWNKNKTVDIYYLSTLTDESMVDFDNSGKYLKNLGSKCSVGIVDRTDVLYYTYPSFSFNTCTKLSIAANKFTCFSFQKYNEMNIEGSSILFNHKINSAQSFKIADDCYVKFVPIMTQSAVETPVDIELPLATVRFNDASQVSAAGNVLKELATNAYQAVIVGTVKSDLAEALETTAKAVDGDNFTLVTKDANNAYQIFMIAPKSWVLRETTAEAVSGSLNAYKLSVEASVE